MVRALLTAWFALTTLPGPGLCCCALRLCAAAPEPAESAPAEPCCPCCRHDPAPDPLSERAPSRCPCKENSAAEATLSPASTADALSHSSIIDCAPAPPQAAPEPTPVGRRAALPSHATSERLRASHFLRC